MSQYRTRLTLKKLLFSIILHFVLFHLFINKKNFHKQRETKNIPIQFQKGNKKIPGKYSSYWIYSSLCFLKKKKIRFYYSVPVYTATKKVRNIYFEFSILLLAAPPLSSRWFIGQRKGGGEKRNLLIRNGHVSPGERANLMAILFLRECTAECRARTWKQAH